MQTRWALAIAGAAGVVLYFVNRNTSNAPAVQGSVPSKTNSTGSSVGGLIQNGGNVIGGVIGGATGFGPAAKPLGTAAGNFAAAEYGGFRQAASGVSQIGSGNVVSGTKDILVGGLKTAAAPFTSTYSTIKGWF